LFESERIAPPRRFDQGGPISTHHLPPDAVVLTCLDVNEAERVLINRALHATNGNRTRAAKLLGMSVRTLRNKLNVKGKSPQAPETSADE
jgi:DNA-binding NtrC family response regulator